ncbi:hypothetical protein [Actinacidiphila oryziradicis]|uniref:Uncharacterized protein n=1 Tax=Actinacidiphila oryziradicis TaxID=2571141 RepID=A0A4U0RWD4_9ACTN|nr:hypothetical protein [Actinacidiphila oryziradicis]TKA00592.1 hypothetical protein FCI23_42450 [Actinacidiphila oryziradicis]
MLLVLADLFLVPLPADTAQAPAPAFLMAAAADDCANSAVWCSLHLDVPDYDDPSPRKDAHPGIVEAAGTVAPFPPVALSAAAPAGAAPARVPDTHAVLRC